MRRSRTEIQPPANSYYAWCVCGFLLLAIGLIYGQALGHILLDYDDSVFVQGNAHVAPGLTVDGFRWAFTDGPGGEWYPLAMLSHMLDCQIYGVHAWGHHLTNLLLHAAASIALFLVCWRMTGELWPSAFVAAVFAVHPQHVEAVAWVAERRDVLSGLFFVLTLAAYLGYVRHGRPLGRYLLVAALLALGLLSKSILVTVPALLLLLDFWPLAQFGAAADVPPWARAVPRPGMWRLVLEKLPLLALCVGASLMTLRTHAGGGDSVAWPQRFGNAAVSYINYLVQFFVPVDLAAFYPIPLAGPPTWQVVGATAILIAVSAAAVVWRDRYPYFFVGWFWYLGMMLPVAGLVKIGWIAMADRYMYLPSIGLTIALAWGAARLSANSLMARRALVACAGVAIVVFVACAARQATYWRDDETLWTRTLACTSNNGEAEVGLADALARRGQLDEAMPYYRQAIQHATDYTPFNQLGLVLAKQGKLDEAVALFRRAVEVEPNAFNPHVNLGLALTEGKQFDEAREQFDRALEIDPLGVKAHGGLAHLLLRQGRLDEACAALERAIAIEPRNISAHYDLAQVLLHQGKIDQSIPHFEAVLAADPQYVPAHVDLARALAARGRTNEAANHYRQALEIDPQNQPAREALDKLLR